MPIQNAPLVITIPAPETAVAVALDANPSLRGLTLAELVPRLGAGYDAVRGGVASYCGMLRAASQGVRPGLYRCDDIASRLSPVMTVDHAIGTFASAAGPSVQTASPVPMSPPSTLSTAGPPLVLPGPNPIDQGPRIGPYVMPGTAPGQVSPLLVGPSASFPTSSFSDEVTIEDAGAMYGGDTGDPTLDDGGGGNLVQTGPTGAVDLGGDNTGYQVNPGGTTAFDPGTVPVVPPDVPPGPSPPSPAPPPAPAPTGPSSGPSSDTSGGTSTGMMVALGLAALAGVLLFMKKRKKGKR